MSEKTDTTREPSIRELVERAARRDRRAGAEARARRVVSPLDGLVDAALALGRELVLQPTLAVATLAPLDASVAAASLERRPDLAAEVRALALVESTGRAVGLHREARPEVRRVRGGVFWAAAVRARWLDPAGCPTHAEGIAERWGIRGAHGLAAAYSVRYLGACVAPEVLDTPLVSAVVTVRRLVELERRYGLRTPAARAEAWRRGVSAAQQRQGLGAR